MKCVLRGPQQQNVDSDMMRSSAWPIPQPVALWCSVVLAGVLCPANLSRATAKLLSLLLQQHEGLQLALQELHGPTQHGHQLPVAGHISQKA